MANEEHLAKLEEAQVEGAHTWNAWRKETRQEIRPDISHAFLAGYTLNGLDFSGANLSEAYLGEANLSKAHLSEADLGHACLSMAQLSMADFRRARLSKANLHGADLSGADLSGADLREANLSGADLHEADLSGARFDTASLSHAHLSHARLCKASLRWVDLRGAELREADLEKADLTGAQLLEADFRGANIAGCWIWGISAWDVKLDDKTEQRGLIVTPWGEPAVTVDDLEVAQFIYLLLNRQKLRNVIDTITSKAVLILGRFTPERKSVLDAMADELRNRNLLPIIFDFERSTARDFTETIKILAGLSLFVIVDLTNPKSAPLELQATVPDYQIPFVPIIQEGEKPFSMFKDLRKFGWVLDPVITYSSTTELIGAFDKAILERAFQKHKELLLLKAQDLSTKSASDYLSGRVP